VPLILLPVKGQKLPLLPFSPNDPFAHHRIARRGPAVALESADQVPHGASILGSATRPHKSRFDPAIVDNCCIHNRSFVCGLFYSAVVLEFVVSRVFPRIAFSVPVCGGQSHSFIHP
jgi:hypothetical protein